MIAKQKQAGAGSMLEVTPEQIQARAYEIYKARQGGPGDAVSDWLQAERELHTAVERWSAPVGTELQARGERAPAAAERGRR